MKRILSKLYEAMILYICLYIHVTTAAFPHEFLWKISKETLYIHKISPRKFRSSWKRIAGRMMKKQSVWEKKKSHQLPLFQLRRAEFLSYLSLNVLVEQFYKTV